ncbi:hypothetical protein TNCV_1264521 [Trichonephila clavipes]|nr:hypothetical protein TNCV_15981 [Trichonephila clavipes]GFV66966.1 hypothetical protein TNCV_1264521 [Trichonephila clavipes]
MPPNTLQIYTAYVLVTPLCPKVLWVVAAKTTSVEDWRIFYTPPVPCLNCGGGDWWHRAIYRKEVQSVSQAQATLIPSSREFHQAKSYYHLYGAQG